MVAHVGKQLKIWTTVSKPEVLRQVFRPMLPDSGIKYEVIIFALDSDEPVKIPEVGANEVLFALGTPVVKVLQDAGYLPKKRTVSSLRGNLFEYGNGHIMVSYSPGLFDIDPESQPNIVWDINLVLRYCMTGSLIPKVGDYRWVEDFSEAVAHIRKVYEQTQKSVYVSLDLETIGLDPWSQRTDDQNPAKPRIVSVAFTYRSGYADVYYCPVMEAVPDIVRKQIRMLCTSPKVKLVGANLKFDYLWLRLHLGITIVNQKFDTFLVGSLLNENIKNSLNLHAKVYTAFGGYDDVFSAMYDKGRMDIVPKEALLDYAGGDTDACYQVMECQRAQLVKDRKLAEFYIKLAQPVATAFANMEYRGIVLDRDQYDQLDAEVLAVIEEKHNHALALVPESIQERYSDNISLGRPSLLRDYLFTAEGLNLSPKMKTAKSGAPSTAIDHLMMFEKDPAVAGFMDSYKEWASAKHTRSTYITGFKVHIRSDGMFHPTYYLGRSDFGGTVTGRSSSKEPAYQTIPKHTEWAKPLRTVYVPPPGMSIIKGDYSQGELRVTACIANEPKMLGIYSNNQDLHTLTGVYLSGVSEAEAKALKNSTVAKDRKRFAAMRQTGKVGNFGLIYGMSAKGLKGYAKSKFGVEINLKKAELFKGRFFEKYAALGAWHDKYKNLARLHGFVRSPLGRIRHIPLITSQNGEVRAKAERQAVNSPVQSTLSDLCAWSIAILHQRYPDLWVFGFTHDEIQAYVKTEDIVLWGRRMKEVMENLPIEETFGWKPQLKFVVDIEASDKNLAECEPLDLS